jgi:hypothetical protein
MKPGCVFIFRSCCSKLLILVTGVYGAEVCV